MAAKMIKPALFAAGLIGLSAGAARADDWGCTVLLCLANPGGPTQYAACVPPVTRLWSHLKRGGAFPTCSGAGSSASPIGYDPYEPCQDGYVLRKLGRDGASQPACVSSKPVRDCGRADDVCQPHDIQAVRHRAQPNFIDVTGADGVSTRVRF
jgi:hypothetical protein